MPSVDLLVATNGVAGTERYVADLADCIARIGVKVTVLGGQKEWMLTRLGRDIPYRVTTSWSQCARKEWGRTADFVHANLTAAELAAVITRRRTGAKIVATRHIAAPRGKTRAGKLVTPYIERHLDLEIAISQYVYDRIERPDAVVLHNGVRPAELATPTKTVLIAQRLEQEKHTAVALDAFHRSELAKKGWELHVCGDGAERQQLEAKAIPGVRFLGWQPDVHERMAKAGALLAPAPGEPLGLTVLEAMARGVPVVAAGAGGHLETLGHDWPGLFPPGDVDAAAERLQQLPDGVPLQARQRELFSLEKHVDRLLELYASL